MALDIGQRQSTFYAEIPEKFYSVIVAHKFNNRKIKQFCSWQSVKINEPYNELNEHYRIVEQGKSQG